MAMLVGVSLITLALALFQSAGLLSGGISSLASVIHYGFGLPFAAVFFALNLPFYWLAMRRMGAAFTVKTVVAVALSSALMALAPRALHVDRVDPIYAALMGGTLLGTGFLILFRHRLSLGGFGILVLYLQNRFGWSAGRVQMAIDCVIVTIPFAVVLAWNVALSVVAAVILNLLLVFNHCGDRYVA
jgi:uncharacterized membrane-anchored protein YitT (DUF2179 family)